MLSNNTKQLTDEETNRIIEMAWEDRTSFDAIFRQFGVSEAQVKQIMRREMKNSSWLMWRKRVCGRVTKHEKNVAISEFKFKCSRQKSISLNKVSKK
jgi:uncharacterized protein (TIGR03643 family)